MRKLAFILPVAVFAAACGTNEGSHSDSPKGGTPRSDAPNGGTLIVAMPADAIDVLPPFVSDQSGAAIMPLIFDRLAQIGADLSTLGDKGFTPQLAKSWTWASDSLSIAFSIDPKARWHDGKPVTAADVKYSLRAFTDPKTHSPVAPLLTNIDSVSVRDSSTAVVYFKKRLPEQFYDVAFQLYILPEHIYGKIPFDKLRTSREARAPIGSGRFRFLSWEPRVQMELIADTANYRGRPKLDHLFLRSITDPDVGGTQVLTGEADFILSFPIDRKSELDSSTVARAIAAQVLQYTFLGMNPWAPKSHREPHPIFGDIRVRRALSMAVDRVGMLHNVFGNLGLIAYGPFPMGQTASDSTLRLPPYDTLAAAAMLDSSGWRRGPDGMRSKNGRPLKFSMLVPSTSKPRIKYAPLLQEQFHRIGANMTIDQVDYGTYMQHVVPDSERAGNFDAMLNTWQPDPSVGGAKQNWSTEGLGPLGQNWLLYSNKTVDAALDSATSTFDRAKTKAYSSRAFQHFIDDIPGIWLYDVIAISGVNRRITVPPLRPDGWFMNLADWSIPVDKRMERDSIGLAPAKKQ